MEEETEGQVGPAMYMDILGVKTRVYTAKPFAHITGYSRRHIRTLCDEGKLIAYKRDGLWWIPESQLGSTAVIGLPFEEQLS